MIKKPVLFLCGKTDLTADLVLLELRKRKVPVIRLNVEDFPTKLLLSASLASDRKSWRLNFFDSTIKKHFLLSQVRSVYARPYNDPYPSSKIKDRQEKNLIVEQSQLVIEWLEDILHCFWLNSPRAVARARSKAFQLNLAAKLGFLTPDSLITNSHEDAQDFSKKHRGKIAAKLLQATPATRKLKGFIFTRRLSTRDLRLIHQVKYSPILLQEYIEKKYEIRATVVGSQVFAAKIDSQALENTQDDWRCYKFGSPPLHKPIKLPSQIQSRLIKMNKRLGIEFGAYDLIYTHKGEYIFLEVNANGQWGWIQELTKLPIASAIAEILINGGE